MNIQDPHSCLVPGAPTIQHIALDLHADFDRRILHGTAEYTFSAPLGDQLELDTRQLHVESVESPAQRLQWTLEEATVLGQVLRITGTRGLQKLRIAFATSPDAPALQWLNPPQTAGGKHPYMYSQCQPIMARSIFPCQDSPSVRFTFDAVLHVPRSLAAVMAAELMERKDEGQQAAFHFHMRHPIPSYLFALAVGNIMAQPIGKRSRVFAEPEIVAAAAWEFADVDRMIEAAEDLFGPYIWDRFDLLVMPPSFPYGGMENPTLTYLTPTLIAGDRSLVGVVAHELAHSWTGNLVTNATWEDFWLNEGWTVYAERRILERLYGTDYMCLQAVNGRNDLIAAMRNFGAGSPFNKLKTDLKGIDPDDVFSSIPYEKGYLFLIAVERAVGRDVFDAFIRSYIADDQFTSMTTAQFVAYLRRKLPQVMDKVDIESWLHQSDLLPSAPSFSSSLIEAVRAIQQKWNAGDRNLQATITLWTVDQKVLFLEELPRKLQHADCALLENWFTIEKTGNSEILVPFYCIAAGSSYAKTYPAIRDFLSRVGRGKYLKPLYRALHENPDTRAQAREIFEAFKDRYHSVGRGAVQRILSA
jgi:leukotriene-A4 hydrolase